MSAVDMKQLFASLREQLIRIDSVAAELETIVQQEREAVSAFDSDQLLALSEWRLSCYQKLVALEAESRELLIQGGASDAITVRAFVELYAGDEAPELQLLRQGIHQRMTQIEQEHAENYIRMRAAFDVTDLILQQVGVVKPQQTYQPGNMR